MDLPKIKLTKDDKKLLEYAQNVGKLGRIAIVELFDMQYMRALKAVRNLEKLGIISRTSSMKYGLKFNLTHKGMEVNK